MRPYIRYVPCVQYLQLIYSPNAIFHINNVDDVRLLLYLTTRPGTERFPLLGLSINMCVKKCHGVFVNMYLIC